MAPFRGPVFSQGWAWLPPWLASSSLQSGAAGYDTPSIFATSWKELEEPISTGNSRSTSIFRDITNKSSLVLHLSEDMSNGALSCQGGQALVLQLSLSQTQTLTDTNLNSGMFLRLESEGGKKSELENRAALAHQFQAAAQELENGGSFKEALGKDKAIKPGVLSKTSPKELVEPSVQQSSKDITAANESALFHGKRSAEESPAKIRYGKKIKLKDKRFANEDLQAAIGLTVATAETLVIADIMNGCQMCESFGPKAILDAALMLKRGRGACGLDEFTVQDWPLGVSTDLNWEEDFDDVALEAEFVAIVPSDSIEASPCAHASTFVVMEEKETHVKDDIALKAMQVIDEKTAGKCSTEYPHSESKESTSDASGVVQRITHALPMFNDNSNVVTFTDGNKAQLMGPKHSFNSRWLGGWTALDCKEDGCALQNSAQAWRRHADYLRLETSELSESFDIPCPDKKSLRCSENGGGAMLNMENGAHLVDALTEGSCAEILMALSQASVKCSLQEPLCSFVPCSVNGKLKASSIKLAGCKDPGLNNNGSEGTTGLCIADTNINLVGQHTDSVLNLSTLDRPCDNLSTVDKQASPPRAVKRFHSKSLKGYSTTPLSHVVQAVVQTIEKEETLQHMDKEELHLCVPMLQDPDSPPVTWHRGKKRRLRACRVVESNVTQGTCADIVHGFWSDDKPAIMKVSTELGKEFNKGNLVPDGNNNLITAEGKTGQIKSGMQKDSCLKMRGSGHLKVLDKADIQHKVYNQRGTNRKSRQPFKGIGFLVTGFPANQRNLSEEVSKKIQLHGGVVLTSVPNISSLDQPKTHTKERTSAQHVIVVAPQKVRTLKYLYGCAAALPIVKPKWIDECIAVNTVCSLNKSKSKVGIRQQDISVCPDKGGTNDLIFGRTVAFVHGQRGYCFKLSLLIQHGGGKVFRSVKSLVHSENTNGCLRPIVIAEHQSKLPRIVIETAANSGLPIVSGDWIIDSLLHGRLVPLPAAANAYKSIRGKIIGNVVTTPNVSQNKDLSARRQGMKRAVSFEKVVTQNAASTHDELHVSFLGKGTATPALSRMGVSFVLEMPKSFTSRKLSSGYMYFKAICCNGNIYSAGDIVEIRPEAEEEQPYIAQIESFYAEQSGRVRSAGTGSKKEPKKPCLVCCRWFYRPSDTGFPCVGTARELYLSQHFDDTAPVLSIIRRVKLVLVLDGKVLTNEIDGGWKPLTETSCTMETADYICRFFYDYQKESLHQLKFALTALTS